MFCPECGKWVADDAEVCASCGARLEVEGTQGGGGPKADASPGSANGSMFSNLNLTGPAPTGIGGKTLMKAVLLGLACGLIVLLVAGVILLVRTGIV